MATMQGAFYEAFGKRIRELRLSRKLTQAHLAVAVKLSRTSITNIEKGRQPVYAHVVVKMAEVLRCQVSDLFETKEPESDASIEHLKNLEPDAQRGVGQIMTPGSPSKEAWNAIEV